MLCLAVQTYFTSQPFNWTEGAYCYCCGSFRRWRRRRRDVFLYAIYGMNYLADWNQIYIGITLGHDKDLFSQCNFLIDTADIEIRQ